MAERTPVPVTEIEPEDLEALIESGADLILDFESNDPREATG